MARQAKRMAVCGMMTALGVVLLLLGSVLGLGIYAAPMFVGWCLVPVGKEWGGKYQILLWMAISVLSFLFVPNVEENLVFACLFGWYPLVRPRLQKLGKLPRLAVKLLLFNAISVALETVLILFLVPESVQLWMIALWILMGNIMFLAYDRAVPVFEMVAAGYFRKLKI